MYYQVSEAAAAGGQKQDGAATFSLNPQNQSGFTSTWGRSTFKAQNQCHFKICWWPTMLDFNLPGSSKSQHAGAKEQSSTHPPALILVT